MKKIILLFVLGLCMQNVFAQRITLKGIVADSSNTALPFVTVTLLKPTDSTLVHFASTEEDGSFEFKNIPSESLVMRISYVGFQPYLQNVAGKESQDFGTIKLQPIMLKEVVLKGEKEPITIKKDTVEYNAGSFKVRPNSSVEELLKKLPGVEVDSEGNVKAQGQNVQKVLVNGKEFFGNDPKTATKNLPADAIEKIQVFDKKSDQAVFSGIDDGEKTKTINLETKNKDKQMSFGKLMAGGGIDEASKGRYEGKANFNTFKNQNQFSLIGMGNNINQSGFSFNDYFEFMGGMNGMRGGGGGGARMMTFDSESMNSLPFAINGFGNGGGNFGFLRNVAGGINLNRKINKDLEMNGSYFLTHANNRIDKTQYSENFLPNTVYASNQTTNQWADNLNHRLNLTFDYKIDSLNSLKLTTSGSLADNNARVNSFVRTLLNNETLQNENQRDNANLSQTLNYNVSLLFRHRFKKKGRTFSTTLGTTGNDQNQEGNLVSNNAFFFPIPSAILLNQENEQRTFAQTYSVKSSYTEPLGKKIYWELNHQYQRNKNESNREVFDVLGEQRILNADFSNSFDNTFQYNRIGTNFKINRKKYNVTVGAGGQFSDLKGVLNNGLDVRRNFNNFLPNASFDYAFSQTRNFRVDYSTSVREPSVQQLQPVVNNTDPLNISLGNPDLRPQYFHRGSINYTRFNPSNFSNFFTFFNVNYTANSIVTSQTINERFVRTTQPVNTRGTFILSNFTNTGFRVNKLKSRFNFGVNTTYNRSINLLNNVESFIHQTSLGGSFRYEFNIEEKFDISLSANLTHQTTNYDFNATQNQRFLNETYTANTNVSFSKRAWATANFNYMIYKSLTNNFYQEMPLLNLSFSALVLPNGKGELKLSVVNALNQNVGVTQNANANSLQQETIQSLGRYAMLSFTYSLSQISNPIQNKQNTRRMMFGN